MNWLKLIISIIAIGVLENIAPKEYRGATIISELFEIALAILFGAWIISSGW